MDLPDKVELQVKLLKPQDGDILVVRVATRAATMEQMQRISERLEERYPNLKPLVCPEEIDVEVQPSDLRERMAKLEKDMRRLEQLVLEDGSQK